MSPVRSRPARAQEGIVLLVTLIVLIAMMLAGVAMMRQVGAGVQIAGNLSFKQIATSVADRGVEAGRTWLLAQSAANLTADAPAAGYFANWGAGFDPATHNWGASASLVTADDGLGNEIRYVIHRMCSTSGMTVNAPGQSCVTVATSGAGGSKGGGSYGVLPLSNTVQPYFRTTVRVAGPRNTVSYVQTIMY